MSITKAVLLFILQESKEDGKDDNWSRLDLRICGDVLSYLSSCNCLGTCGKLVG